MSGDQSFCDPVSSLGKPATWSIHQPALQTEDANANVGVW